MNGELMPTTSELALVLDINREAPTRSGNMQATRCRHCGGRASVERSLVLVDEAEVHRYFVRCWERGPRGRVICKVDRIDCRPGDPAPVFPPAAPMRVRPRYDPGPPRLIPRQTAAPTTCPICKAKFRTHGTQRCCGRDCNRVWRAREAERRRKEARRER